MATTAPAITLVEFVKPKGRASVLRRLMRTQSSLIISAPTLTSPVPEHISLIDLSLARSRLNHAKSKNPPRRPPPLILVKIGKDEAKGGAPDSGFGSATSSPNINLNKARTLNLITPRSTTQPDSTSSVSRSSTINHSSPRSARSSRIPAPRIAQNQSGVELEDPILRPLPPIKDLLSLDGTMDHETCTLTAMLVEGNESKEKSKLPIGVRSNSTYSWTSSIYSLHGGLTRSLSQSPIRSTFDLSAYAAFPLPPSSLPSSPAVHVLPNTVDSSNRATSRASSSTSTATLVPSPTSIEIVAHELIRIDSECSTPRPRSPVTLTSLQDHQDSPSRPVSSERQHVIGAHEAEKASDEDYSLSYHDFDVIDSYYRSVESDSTAELTE